MKEKKKEKKEEKKKEKQKKKKEKKNKKEKIFPLPSKTMGCFSAHLMSTACDQKLFFKLCSPFCCSFDEFVEEKVISLSYSSAIFSNCQFCKTPTCLFSHWFLSFSSVCSWLLITLWATSRIWNRGECGANCNLQSFCII